MRYRVKLQWAVVTELTPSGMVTLSDSNLLFNRKGGGGFLRSIGGRFRTKYAPVVLEPTDIFHSALSEMRDKLKFSGKKFPYTVEDFVCGLSTRLNVKIHLFGRVLCINFILDEFDTDIDEDSEFSALQSFDSHPRLKNLALKIIAIIASGDHRAPPLSSLPKYYPAIRIVSLQTDPIDWHSRMAVLLSRHATMLDSAISEVLKKNQPHQVDKSLLLVDKQGVVAYVPFSDPLSAAGNLQRFRSAVSMLELAATLQSQISKGVVLPSDVVKVITSADEAIPDSVSAQRTWILINSELKLLKELNYALPKGTSKIMKRILIVTVTQIESQSVLAAFAEECGQVAKARMFNNHVYQELGVIGTFECFLAISEMGTGGTSGSLLSVQKAIEDIKPDTVIMAGIAFGIDKKKFSIGDVLVSQQLLLYDLQRMNSNGTIALRGDTPHASSAPLNWVRHAKLTWPSISNSKVEPGLVLSGDKLVDNIDYRNALSEVAPEALGGEMEGAGLYAACQVAKVDWLLVKAICDWADGNKSKNKSTNQQKAAANAARFVVHLLKFSAC